LIDPVRFAWLAQTGEQTQENVHVFFAMNSTRAETIIPIFNDADCGEALAA